MIVYPIGYNNPPTSLNFSLTVILLASTFLAPIISPIAYRLHRNNDNPTRDPIIIIMSHLAMELSRLSHSDSFSLADSDVSVLSLNSPTNTNTNTNPIPIPIPIPVPIPIPNPRDANIPKHPSTEITAKNDSDGDVTIMALQTTDALSRTFGDLKSKSEDVRLRASYDLYRLVATASRGM